MASQWLLVFCRSSSEQAIPVDAGESTRTRQDHDRRERYHLWDGARVYRLAPDGGLSVLAHCEYPNGLALSPDERIMYLANTRSSQ